MPEKEYVIDCDSQVLGRLASHTAKLLLSGASVKLVNAEKAAISGHVSDIVANYKQKLEFIDKANPEHSPYWSRRPDLLVKRVVRGMLPWKKPKGREAFKRLRVYVGTPSELGKEKIAKEVAKNRSAAYESTITVGELSEKLGYKVN
ncbi:MAG: 50S ribosomal protein L13 [Candidatus Micrarchaeota archaeon]|nr:50S ribosomal protein L13 [Candidatus Micrarchaeota archaeon]